MFCSFSGIRLTKTLKPMFILSVLVFVLGVQVCFGQTLHPSSHQKRSVRD